MIYVLYSDHRYEVFQNNEDATVREKLKDSPDAEVVFIPDHVPTAPYAYLFLFDDGTFEEDRLSERLAGKNYTEVAYEPIMRMSAWQYDIPIGTRVYSCSTDKAGFVTKRTRARSGIRYSVDVNGTEKSFFDVDLEPAENVRSEDADAGETFTLSTALFGEVENCMFYVDKYELGGQYIGIACNDPEYGWEPFTDVTIRMSGVPDGCIAVKSYSENEGLLEGLMALGFITRVVDTRRSGFAEIPICEYDKNVLNKYLYSERGE